MAPSSTPLSWFKSQFPPTHTYTHTQVLSYTVTFSSDICTSFFLASWRRNVTKIVEHQTKYFTNLSVPARSVIKLNQCRVLLFNIAGKQIILLGELILWTIPLSFRLYYSPSIFISLCQCKESIYTSLSFFFAIPPHPPRISLSVYLCSLLSTAISMYVCLSQCSISQRILPLPSFQHCLCWSCKICSDGDVTDTEHKAYINGNFRKTIVPRH